MAIIIDLKCPECDRPIPSVDEQEITLDEAHYTGRCVCDCEFTVFYTFAEIQVEKAGHHAK